jgi:hypothetical protein
LPEVEWGDLKEDRQGESEMKTAISLASVLACAFAMDAQITATLNRLPNGMPEIRIRNNLGFSAVAFAIRMNPVVRTAENNSPFVEFFDTAIDAKATPLLPNQERTIPVLLRRRPGGRLEDLFEQAIITAGIFANGTTTGDAALLKRLINRRSNMLAAVETAMEMLIDAGGHNTPRDQLIEQFKKMARSVSHSYLPPEQQVGRDLYQSIIGKLINLPDQPLGSPFPPAAFVAEETAMLNRQRVTLSESQPSLADAALIGR